MTPINGLMKVEENDSPGQKGLKISPRNRQITDLNLQSFDTPGTPLEEAQGATQSEPEKKEKTKMVITGDDILIEYVHRIVKLMDTIL